MRAGPLSDRRVIDTLNRSFVCVYLNNEDYLAPDGKAPAEERAEMQRIRQEGFAKNLPVGNVRSWVLSPDGHAFDMLTHTSKTLAMLQHAVAEFKPAPGKPVVPPTAQSAPPTAPAGAVVMHLIARGDDRGSWGQFPAENWIVLDRADWWKLMPRGQVWIGTSWELDRTISARILTYFYPQTENNDAALGRLQEYGLVAKVISVADGQATARIDGWVRMLHTFYPGRNDPQPLAAAVVGVMTFGPDRIPSIQLVTTHAQHGMRPFTVAVRTVSQSAR